MNLRPFTLARYGIYAALGIAILSLLLAREAGTSVDVAAARSLLIFVVFSAIAFGAEAVLWSTTPAALQPLQPMTADESAAESTPGVEDAA